MLSGLAAYDGQIVLRDAGFYLRDVHTYLIREERLILGVNNLDELPEGLRRAVLLIEDKEGGHTTAEDAETLATYTSRFPRGTMEFTAEVQRWMD